MSRVRGRDTKPEMRVRSLTHAMGYRYRLHRRDLPGNPDLVFPARRSVVFVHGCFWHRHACRKASTPKSNTAFWEAKFAANVRRDRRNVELLAEAGWQVLVLWECELRDERGVRERIANFLGPPGRTSERAQAVPDAISDASRATSPAPTAAASTIAIGASEG